MWKYHAKEIIEPEIYLRFYLIPQPVWMHLRCILETSHAASQRHLKDS